MKRTRGGEASLYMGKFIIFPRIYIRHARFPAAGMREDSHT